VPVELSQDHSTILLLAQETNGIITVNVLAEQLMWDENRSSIALNVLLREGMVWIDDQVIDCLANMHLQFLTT